MLDHRGTGYVIAFWLLTIIDRIVVGCTVQMARTTAFVFFSSPRRTLHHICIQVCSWAYCLLSGCSKLSQTIPLSAFVAGVALVDGVFAEDRGDFFDFGFGGDRYAR